MRRPRAAPPPRRRAIPRRPAARRLQDRERSREAVRKLLENPTGPESRQFFDIANDMDAVENIKFYHDVQEYKKLFQAQDRIERAKRIYEMHLDPQCDRSVTLPDMMTKNIEKKVKSGEEVPPEFFKKAEFEVLRLIVDNMYPVYLKNEAAAAQKADAPADAPPPSGGGCCVIV